MSTPTYSACKVIVTVAGIRIQGFGETDMVSAERDADKFTKSTGADGRSSRSHNCSNAGKIKITLQQTSEANDVLSKLLLADEATLDAKFPVSIVDRNGSTNIIGGDCWLMGPPAAALNSEIGDVVWNIDVSNLYMFIGGNDRGLIDSLASFVSAII